MGTYYIIPKDDELYHVGVKGMKWGVRKQRPVSSLSGRAHRAYGKVFEVNENYYRKRGNSTMASMNASARRRQQQLAKQADAKKANKYKVKRNAKIAKIKAQRSLEGNARRALSSIYASNERFYRKHSNNKTLASMNDSQKNRQLKLAEQADEKRRQKKLSRY